MLDEDVFFLQCANHVLWHVQSAHFVEVELQTGLLHLLLKSIKYQAYVYI